MEEYVLYLIHRKAYEEAAKIARGKLALDWGCNNGYGIEILRSLGCRNVSGLDISSEAIESAKARLGTNTELILQGEDPSSLPSEKYDVVMSFQCIEHVLDHDGYLSAIKRVLKPDGVAVFTTPNAAIRIFPGMKPWNEYHVLEFRSEELSSLLSRHFSTVRVRGLFAIDEIHKVEMIRCARSRDAARGTLSPLAILRRVTPSSIKKLLRKHTANGRPPSIGYSTAELFYQDGDLDKSLDLFAICTK